MKTCNSRTTMGHNEMAVCGQQYYSEVYQCGECAKKELAELRITLEAESKGADRAAEALLTNYRDLVAAKAQLATLVRLLKIVVEDPHRAWQIVEKIDQTLKTIEGLESCQPNTAC